MEIEAFRQLNLKKGDLIVIYGANPEGSFLVSGIYEKGIKAICKVDDKLLRGYFIEYYGAVVTENSTGAKTLLKNQSLNLSWITKIQKTGNMEEFLKKF